MTEQGFTELVQRLTARAQRQPQRFRLEVFALAAVGYLYVLLLVLGALLVSAVLVVICFVQPILLVKLLKIIWLPIWFAWSVLKSIWVRFDPPQGRPLSKAEAPALFAEIDRIRAAIPGPKPHQVLVTDDYNAAVAEHARLGALGWWRNYLILGLPMMSAMSPDQFRAVLAHEFGHFGAGDSRMTGRIYRMRVLWGRLQQQFSERGGFFFKRFFAWFGPKFNAYSFVLARAQEYAADAASARLVGADPAAQALVIAQIGHDYQESQVWKPVWQRVPHDPEPTARPFAQLLEGGHRYGDWSDAEARLQRAMQHRTNWSDTHPALNDRLAALGKTAAVPPAAGQSAAAMFLGPTAEVLAKEFDDRWRAGVAQPWRERHEQRQQERRELITLDEKAAGDTGLDTGESWRQAVLTETVHDSATALPRFQAFAEAHPDIAEARYAIGQILLRQGDESGIAIIDTVMQQDPNAIKPGAVLIHEFLMERGRVAEAKPYIDAWQARDELEQRAAAERAEFSPKDHYLSPDIDDAQQTRLREACAGLGWLAKVWLVRKQVDVFPEQPAYLLLAKPRWYKRIKRAQAEAELRQALDLADTLTVALHSGDLKSLFKRATKAEGSEIYAAR
ncbi:M48 family metallopeptidase [Nevskia sp.]|uniref:M48 family metallopeptidase n=1 Tax=Nevskia sp. TaxID=1929292 RepID=UPI0025E6246F|nr:M48 family metallopeptidase [Nevskia sp.]